MKRVVFDTNIFISAFITPGGRGETAYQKAVDGNIQLYSSVPILTELAIKLQDKFKWDTDRVRAAVRHVAALATVLKPSERISVVADEPDNRILECAVAGNVDMVVTGDKHLLDLKTYERIEIVTLAVFLERT